MAQFLQEVAPLFSHALGQEMYDGGFDEDSLQEGSLMSEDVNQEHVWPDRDSLHPRDLWDCEIWQETVDAEENDLPPAAR